MSRIALIKTDVLNTAHFTVAIPLGILHLASAARSAGHQASVVDLTTFHPHQFRPLLDKIVSLKPEFIGLSALSQQMPVLDLVCRYLRPRLPKAVFLAGGPLASSEREDLLRDVPELDILVIGEGEETLKELLGWKDKGGSLDDIKGIIYRKGGECVATSPRPLIADLDSLPGPSYDLIDIKRYSRFLTPTQRMYLHGGIITSRGCPYRCKYCHNIHGKTFRPRSVQNVMEEVRFLKKRFDIRYLEIYDDIFNFDYDRATEILERINHEFPGLRLCFWNGLRLDNIDEKFIRLMARNTDLFSVPVESASPRIRKMIGRTADYAKVPQLLKWTRKHGVPTWGYFMVGFPGETIDEVDMTIRSAWSLDLDFPILIQFLPFKNTPLADMVLERGGTLPRPSSMLYHKSDVNYSDAPTEYIQKARVALWKNVIIKRPRNWYLVYNLLFWITRWQGPLQAVWYLMNSSQMNFSRSNTGMQKATGRFLHDKRLDVLNMLKQQVGID